MISVLLTILKVLGWIVLSILLLVFFILLLVMIVPFGYGGSVSCHGKPDIEVKGWWLFRAVTFRMAFHDKLSEKELRLFRFIRIPINSASSEESEEESDPEETSETEDAEDENEEEETDPVPKKKRSFDEITEDLLDKYDFLTEDESIETVSRVLRLVYRILAHIMPVSAEGSVRFGLQSPADTGKVIAIVSALKPIHHNNLEIIPEFEENVLEADARLRGRITVGYIVVQAIAAVLNRNVLHVIKNFKKHFG